MAARLCCALLMLQLVLHSCAAVAIYEPQVGGGERDSPRGREDADDEGAGVITVYAGKVKPPRVLPPPPPAIPPPAVPSGCERPKRRTRRSAKPLPVREKIRVKKSAPSNFHCPESWKELDFSEVQELECPGNATGWFPFPPDCRKYLNCWKGRGFLQPCSPGTLFDPIRRDCDYPKKVKCLPSCRSDPEGNVDSEEDDIVGDPVDYVDPEHPRRPSPLIDVRSAFSGPVQRVAPEDATEKTPSGRSRRYAHNARLVSVGGIQCQMEGGTGLQAHPVDCTKFVNCWQGSPHIMSCAPGSLFSTSLNACDHPHKVKDCVGGKRVSPGVEPPPAQPGGDALPLGYTQAGGGYNQFGNQGYQPPPRQTFLKPSDYADQVPAASSVSGGYGPNRVLPPTGAGGKGKSLHPELQPRPSQQEFGPETIDPNLDVERIESGGVIGPLPRPHPGPHPGHSEQWHRQHGILMPGEDVPPGHNPAFHQHHHHHHHQHQHQPGTHYTPTPPGQNHGYHHHHAGTSHQPERYTPRPERYNPSQGGYTPSQGGYTPSQSGYNPSQGVYNPSQGGYNPSQGGYNPSQGGYNPSQGGYTPSQGGYTPHPGRHNPQEGGHNPHWHHSHGIPMPGAHRGTDRVPTTTPSYEPAPVPTTTCAPTDDMEWKEDEGDENDFREYDIDLRTAPSNNWLTVLERTKNTSMPQSGQMVRIRGGPTPLEGYVEVMGPGSKWGSVCDKPAEWTVEEATIVCKMLGYERGAELAWQGRPRNSPGVLDVHVEEIHCSGQERSLMSCAMSAGDAGDGCNLETQAAGLRCYPNYVARCRPGEVPFKGSCYSVVVPRQDRKVDAIAFSQDEAIKHCKSQGGHLLDINSQAENDFISEWLTTAHPALGSVLTSGVGVAVPGRDVWVWEETRAQFQYNLWWPGPPNKEFDPVKAPKVGDRPLCILLKKDFPCDSWPGAAAGRGGRGTGYGSWQGARSCAAEYFFWHAEDCAIRQKAYPYVCERKADDVGCIGPSGTEYEGAANISWNGLPCVSWDSPASVSALRYRVSDDIRLKSLSGHNHCRKVGGGSGGGQEPWCFVDAGTSGIKAERCDIPQCRENTAVGRAAVIHCGPQQFECSPNECIPNAWQCDGEPDCSNSLDERSCSDYLVEYKEVKAAKLEGHDVERWLHLDANTCARRCLDATDFICKSFSYKSSTKVCLLSRTNVGETGSLQRTNRTAWTYYERKELSDPCTDRTRFLCANGKCVNATNHCNGHDDCGDRSDEGPAGGCTAATIGYELRLAGGKSKSEGRIEVKVKGQWGAVCDDGFGLPEADVVCREAGYPDGAVEVLSGGRLPAPHKSLPILVDELLCAGNETSLMGCEHAGWGVHDCLPEEMVGVRCATAAGLECNSAAVESPELHGGFAWGAILQLATKHCRQASRVCPENHWQCESGECVPAKFLCDSVSDCKDGSDEHARRCQDPMGMRLVGGANEKEGRLEVKVYGEWGSVCDDDFSEAAAVTVCRQLGMPGKARVYKEAHFGQGQGLMWLDDVRCHGNETKLEYCNHADFGVTNCKHDEDVGVACLGSDDSATGRTPEEVAVTEKEVDVNKYLPSDCGTRPPLEDEFEPTVQLARVVSGRGTPRGAYPWQASLRVRSGTKSVHWCGAVLIGPLHVLTAAHCLDDFTKSAYFVRVGDYNSEDDDGTEQEANIESVHVHEHYNKNVHLENDVALIRVFGAGFTMNDAVRPACMPKSTTAYTPGTNCSISGWGSVGTSGSGYSRLLRSTWLPILSTDACSAPNVYGKKNIVSGMFCAGHLEGGADACQGDSGGPMVCLTGDDRFTLYGITSWGHGCGMTNKPGVYTNVTHYLPWVHEMIQRSVRSS